MRRFRFAAVVGVSLLLIGWTGSADADHRTGSYPKVRTFSGGYYGPTQAHYQYQRRYGRPWHGQGGFSARGHVGHWPATRSFSFGFGWPTYGYGGIGYGGFGYGGFGYGGFGYGSAFGFGDCGYGWGSSWGAYPFGVTVLQPSLILQNPGIYTPLPTTNPLAAGALLNNGSLLQQQIPGLLTPDVQPLGVQPLGDPDVSLLPPSTPQARLRSLQHQQRGDARLRDLSYLHASQHYQDAIKTAADRVEPRYRLGIALAGMKQFDEAVRELKTATAIDPSWVDSITLDELVGDDQLIGKTNLKQRVAEWTLGDAYDADRLYLLGTLLYLDGDPQRARIMFETAAALVGQEPHLTVFLSQPRPAPAAPVETEPTGAGPSPLPPVPEPKVPPPPEPTVLPNEATTTHPAPRQPIGPVFPTSF